MSTWVCACICFSFVPEMIERMKVWYVIEFWHKCTEGLKNLIRISSIRNNKKYPTIKKIFEAGDFYAILSDIVEKISIKPGSGKIQGVVGSNNPTFINPTSTTQPQTVCCCAAWHNNPFCPHFPVILQSNQDK